MAVKRIFACLLASLIIVLLSMLYLSNISFSIVESDMNDPNYWLAEAIGYGSNVYFEKWDSVSNGK
ncbi:MAG: hypothetical protein QXR45_03820 [Candidatus Bathyarchaeia archaeon]